MRRTWMAVTAAFVLGGLTNQAFAERNPKMESALVHIRYALASLGEAPKSPQRDKAISLLQQAIDEVNKTF